MPTMVYTNGDVYVGECKEGKRDGRGSMTYNCALICVYDGDWKGGQQYGQGRMTYSDGCVYDGEWRWGLPDGQGKMTYSKGSVYEADEDVAAAIDVITRAAVGPPVTRSDAPMN